MDFTCRVYSRIRTESTILSLYEKRLVRENPYSGVNLSSILFFGDNENDSEK